MYEALSGAAAAAGRYSICLLYWYKSANTDAGGGAVVADAGQKAMVKRERGDMVIMVCGNDVERKKLAGAIVELGGAMSVSLSLSLSLSLSFSLSLSIYIYIVSIYMLSLSLSLYIYI